MVVSESRGLREENNYDAGNDCAKPEMTAKPEMMTLQEQCLNFLVGNLEHFHVWSLSLLPTLLRRQLLLSVPLVDLCHLEQLPMISSDINMEAVWEQLCDKRGVNFSSYFQKLPTHRDSFLNVVARALLLVVPPQEFLLRDLGNPPPRADRTKLKLLVGLLFSVKCTKEQSPPSFIMVSKHSAMYLPPRYSRYHYSFTLLDALAQFNEHCCWFPRVLDISPYQRLDNSLISFDYNGCPIDIHLQCLFAQMEEFRVEFPRNEHALKSSGAETAFTLLNAAAKASSCTACLKVVSLQGCVTILEWLLPRLFDVFAINSYRNYALQSNSSTVVYTKLKTIEIIGNGSVVQARGGTSYLYNCREHIAAILGSQEELEEVVLEGMMNVERQSDSFMSAISYEGFDDLFHFLPTVVMKPSFRSLTVARSLIPANALVGILCAFLNTPTTHPQKVDIGGSWITQESSPFTLLRIEFPKIPTPTLHSSWNLKSLSIPFSNSQYFPPESILRYLQSTLRNLEIICHPKSISDLQRICNTVVQLPMGHLSIHFHCDDADSYISDANQDLLKVLWSASVKILGFHNCLCSVETYEQGILSVLAQGLLQHSRLSHLTALQLNRMRGISVDGLKQLYEAIFALPQLSEFTLDLSNNNFHSEHHQSLVEAYGVGRKLKLKKLVYKCNSCSPFHPIAAALREIAVEVEM